MVKKASIFLEDASYLMEGDFTETKDNLHSNSKYEGVFFLVLYPDCQIRVLSAGFGNPAEP